jgi:hypothetical protein
MSQREQELKDSLWGEYGRRFGSRLLDVYVGNGNGSVLTSRVFIGGYESVGQQIAEGWSHGEETVLCGLHIFPVAFVEVTELDNDNPKE